MEGDYLNLKRFYTQPKVILNNRYRRCEYLTI